MKKSNRTILFNLAYYTARGLSFFGIRRLPGLQAGKSVYFVSALVFSLAFLGCSADPAAARLGGLIQGNDEANDGDPVRIKELNKKKAWLEFKSVWKNLDAVEPGNEADSAFYPVYAYAANPDRQWCLQQSENITNSLDELEPQLYNLVKEDLLDSTEVDILMSACRQRVEYIFSGFQSMFMRMIPPPGQVRKEGAIMDLERRIDHLQKLYKEEKIDQEELDLALKNAQKKIELFGLLDIICQNPTASYMGDLSAMTPEMQDTIDQVQIEMDAFEENRAEFLMSYEADQADENQRNIYKAYERTHAELSRYKAALPGLNELLKDLIVND